MSKITNLRNILIFVMCVSGLTACGQTKPKEKNMKFEVNKTDAEWKQKLDSEQYYVLREKGTERPYTGKFLLTKDKGNYVCGACGNVLFNSDAKFDSHCGWPSFDKEIAAGRILEQKDTSHGMERTEILCAKCGSHLGHVFNDGPTQTGLRYCVNSLSLGFEKEGSPAVLPKHETIVIGGGCYWCTEAIFQNLKGVESVESGFSGGTVKNPSYREVCTGQTGHAEVIKIVYNPAVVKLETILEVFFALHDPTTLNRQGADEGTQYRSAIFFADEYQKEVAENTIAKLTKEHAYADPIVTTLEPFKVFYKAEDYHQNYYNDNSSQPYCQAVIKPKLDKFNKYFKSLKK